MPRTNQYQLLVDDLLGTPRQEADREWLEICERRASLLEEITHLIRSHGYGKTLSELMRKLPWLNYAPKTLEELKEHVQSLIQRPVTLKEFKTETVAWHKTWLEGMKRLHAEYLAALSLAEAAEAKAAAESRAKEEERRAKEEERRAKEEERRAKEALAVRVKELETQLASRKNRVPKRTHTSCDLFLHRKKARTTPSSDQEEISSESSRAAH